MPKCLDCGTETPRELMYGPPDELRCQACAQAKTAVHYLPRREVAAESRLVVTMALIVVSTLLTVLYWQDPEQVAWAVAAPVPVWSGQVWRYITSTLIHGNVLHLLFNLYWLWVFGRVVEAWMGSIRFAGFFILVGMGSSAGQMLVSAQGGIGLSGVGYGLFGLLYSLRRDKDFAAALINSQTVQLFVFWFFLCIALTYAGVMPVANTAHGVGAVAGWLIGRAILSRQRLVLLAAVSAGVLALIGASLYMPWNGSYALYQGNRYLEKGQYREAVYWYSVAERSDPGNTELRKFVSHIREAADARERQGE